MNCAISGAINHGVHQLTLAMKILDVRLQSDLAGLFPGTEKAQSARLRIQPCMLCSHRVFSGLSLDGIPVRDFASLAPICGDGIPGATGKDKENRRIPFNPEGRLAAILKRRVKLGPDAYVFASASGEYQSELQTAWETLRLLAHGIEPRPTRTGAAWNRKQLQPIRSPLALPAARRHVPPAGGRGRHPHHSADARPREHSADAAMPERDRRRTQKGTGGELEQQRPTTSTRGGSMNARPLRGRIGPTRCPIFVTRDVRAPRNLVAGARNQHYLQLWRPAA